MTHAEPTIEEVNNLTSLVPAGAKSEPVLLLDTSGSMTWGAAAGSDHPTRKDVVEEAIGIIIEVLEGQDSEAAAEQADGSDDKGGLLIIGFSGEATNYGDFNSSNRAEKWKQIHFGGGTRIMEAWGLAQEEYMEEFGERDALDRPILKVTVITDGEAEDAGQFAKVLEGAKAGRCFCVAVVGNGEAHDNTLASYRKVEAANPKRVRVLTFDSETNPRVIAEGVLSVTGEQ